MRNLQVCNEFSTHRVITFGNGVRNNFNLSRETPAGVNACRGDT